MPQRSDGVLIQNSQTPAATKIVAPRVIKTSNVDLFLQCDDMTLEELLIATELEDQKDLRSKKLKLNSEDGREQEPDWADVKVEEVKRSGDEALKMAARAVTSSLMSENPNNTSNYTSDSQGDHRV